MAANPMMLTMLKTLGIDPNAIAEMGGSIGAAFKELTAAAREHTATLARMEEKLDAVMDHCGISLPLTEEQETLVAEESQKYLLSISNANAMSPARQMEKIDNGG